jgi:hypothetical protein
MRAAWRRSAALGAVALAWACVSCTTPTLPLPPPALPTIGVGPTAGTYHLTSDRGALPNALVVAVNRNETLPRNDRVAATLADANGSWDLVIKATGGDFIDLSQEDGSTRSPSTTVEVH